MTNMSHCRFENTLLALEDCVKHMNDKDLSPDEDIARSHLKFLCLEIAESYFSIYR